MRERSHDLIHFSGELRDDSQPGFRSSAAEVPLATSDRVWLSMVRHLDCSHDLVAVARQGRMVSADMVPLAGTKLNNASLGVSNTGNNTIRHAPTLTGVASRMARDMYRDWDSVESLE